VTATPSGPPPRGGNSRAVGFFLLHKRRVHKCENVVHNFNAGVPEKKKHKTHDPGASPTLTTRSNFHHPPPRNRARSRPLALAMIK